MRRNKLKVEVGVGVLINKNKKRLLMKRKGSHGSGSWAPPGGHLDFGESIFKCAKREVKEEVGAEIKNLKIIGFTNDIFKKDKKHYITIWVNADWKSNEPKIKNQEMSKIGWFKLKKLPKPLFIPFKNFTRGKILPGRTY